jgi:hypothetical protein
MRHQHQRPYEPAVDSVPGSTNWRSRTLINYSPAATANKPTDSWKLISGVNQARGGAYLVHRRISLRIERIMAMK